METSTNQLRLRNRELRSKLNREQLDKAAAAVCDRICALVEYQQAQKIAVYFAVNGEIGLTPLIDQALAQRKQIYLPNLDQKALRFSPYDHAQKMRINRFKLPEPDVADDEMLEAGELDLVLVPLVVFDSDRNRIGMGGGFYDRSFAFRKEPDSHRPQLIGVAHELQKVAQLVPEDWDVRLDMVVTDQATYL
ncbi:MAG: 5-formyltetrahydrofolate cyclo-ligase [Gammaproteobacteria bacterium]|nr:MAG: 5-formyltetrahydrofolate cyclo-ligase [Gammaproteobacteria bacterium]